MIRATQDVDFLVDVDDADEIDQALTKLGYRCLHRSAEAGNYLRDDERVDLLYASRPIARRLLAGATEQKTAFGDLRVIGPEGLIGFKLQGWINDPRRMNFYAKPTEHFFAGNGGVVAPVSSDRDPFEALDDLMVVIEALCPTWPHRETFENADRLRM